MSFEGETTEMSIFEILKEYKEAEENEPKRRS